MSGLQLDYIKHLGLQKVYFRITFGVHSDYKTSSRITKNTVGLHSGLQKKTVGLHSGLQKKRRDYSGITWDYNRITLGL